MGTPSEYACRPLTNPFAGRQGMITLWDVEGGLPQLDKYLYSQDPQVVAGALLGVGIVNANVQVWL